MLIVGSWRDADGGDSWHLASRRSAGPRLFWYGNVLIDPRSMMGGRRMPGWKGLHAGVVSPRAHDTLIVYGGWPDAAAKPLAVSFVHQRVALGMRLTPTAAFVAGAHGWWLVGIGGGLIGAPIATPAVVRAWRRSRSLCAGCGYPAEGVVCPECGAKQ